MEKKKILKVLKKVKSRIQDKDYDMGHYGKFKAYGLCWLIMDTLLMMYEGEVPLTLEPIDISDYVPLATYENAQEHCEATKPNVGIGSELWWRDNIMNNPGPRLNFINWLITEYENKD